MTVIRKRNRIKETGEIKRKPGSGRPQTLSDREQRNICTQSRRDAFTTAVQIHRSLTGMNGKARCSVRTVRNVLIKNNLNGRVAARKPYLTAAHKQASESPQGLEGGRMAQSHLFRRNFGSTHPGGREEVLSSATRREISTQLPPHCQTRWGVKSMYGHAFMLGALGR